MSAPAATPCRVRIARRVGFAAWAALLLLQLAWHGAWGAGDDGTRLPALLLSVVPLLLPLAALRRPSRALLLAGMLALFYFAHGVSDAWSVPASRPWAYAEIALSLLLIGAIGAGMQKRPRQPGAPTGQRDTA